MTAEWVIPAFIFLFLGVSCVGAGRASGWNAHIKGDPHGDTLGYLIGVFLWVLSVLSSGYLGAVFFA